MFLPEFLKIIIIEITASPSEFPFVVGTTDPILIDKMETPLTYYEGNLDCYYIVLWGVMIVVFIPKSFHALDLTKFAKKSYFVRFVNCGKHSFF